MPLAEMANLFNSLRLSVCPGLVSSDFLDSSFYLSLHLRNVYKERHESELCIFQDPNPNNLVASTTFYSESTQAMLCLVSYK